MNEIIDRTPAHLREAPETITCECGAVVLENKITKELVHVGDCSVNKKGD